MNKPKKGMEQYRPTVEQNLMFTDPASGHVFMRGPLLGKGGFGFVYQTSMPGYTRRLVLKAIPVARVTKPTQKQRIHNEVQLHKSLDHENIVKLYHSFEEEHVICMIIERCERSLLDLLSEQNRHVRYQDVSVCARQVFYALQYLHKNGVIHRDLKLGNVLLKSELFVKVCDFGLAKKYNPKEKPSICGTPNYLAPEVLEHKGHRPESDIWSVGCVLVVLLDGHAPFEGQTTGKTYELIITKEPRLPDSIPEYLASFLTKVLTKSVKKRITIDEALKHPFISMYMNVPPKVKVEKITEERQPLAAVPSSRSHNNSIRSKIRDITGAARSGGVASRIGLPGRSSKNKSSIPAIKPFIEDEGINQIYTSLIEPELGSYLWIQCWIDYTNKDCGFAYRLSNSTVGVKLKENKISYILKKTGDKSNMRFEYYSESRNKLIDFSENCEFENKYDDRFSKHVDEMRQLVNYYDDYMSNNLINDYNKAITSSSTNCKVRLIDWYKTKQIVGMCLSNYTIQVNFFQTHHKVIIQGQFNSGGSNMPIPLSPEKDKNYFEELSSVVGSSQYDVKQEFKIIFINCKRETFNLNVQMVLKLIREGPSREFTTSSMEMGVTSQELLTALANTHLAMHSMIPFSKRCYSESQICNAFRSKRNREAGHSDQSVGYAQQEPMTMPYFGMNGLVKNDVNLI